MKPSIDDLKPFVKDRTKAAEKYNVSERTISRWMKSYDIYLPKSNYGVKLDIQKAREIRTKYTSGILIKDLAEQYDVTFSAISRIINNVTYCESHDTAQVNVTYNIK